MTAGKRKRARGPISATNDGYFQDDGCQNPAAAGLCAAGGPAVVQHFTYNPNETERRWRGTYQRRPTEDELNQQLRNSDKSPDLGWMYTVIAGVLNILVIYDALVGPAYGPHASKQRPNPAPQE